MPGSLFMIIYIYNQILYFTGIGDFPGECLTEKNYWELLTGDDWVGIMKIFTMVNGKDILRCTYKNVWRIYKHKNFELICYFLLLLDM